MHHIPFETAEVFIAGRWRPGARGGRLMLVNPSDGQPLREGGWTTRFALRYITWHVLDLSLIHI